MNGMTVSEIRALAKSLGITVAGLNKPEAIRAIQSAEGNFDCFGRAESGFCDQQACLFRQDCLRASTNREKNRNKA
jgi:hypothetical protein